MSKIFKKARNIFRCVAASYHHYTYYINSIWRLCMHDDAVHVTQGNIFLACLKF